MKARQLAAILLQFPDMDVTIESPVVGLPPMPIEENGIAANNEANAFIIFLPSVTINPKE